MARSCVSARAIPSQLLTSDANRKTRLRVCGKLVLAAPSLMDRSGGPMDSGPTEETSPLLSVEADYRGSVAAYLR